MKSLTDIKEVKEKFKSLLEESNTSDQINHDALILMASYLDEIERIQDEKQVNRKNLAKLISISASYLTQVFRGNKPLNFQTIAKIQKALNIKFEVKAKYVTVEIVKANGIEVKWKNVYDADRKKDDFVNYAIVDLIKNSNMQSCNSING